MRRSIGARERPRSAAGAVLRSAVFSSLVVLAGCGAVEEDWPDGQGTGSDSGGPRDATRSAGLDAGASDLGVLGDVGELDSGLDPPAGDAGGGGEDATTADLGPLDGGAALDAGVPDSGWGGCSVGGVAGTCQHVSTCTGDQEPTPGLCPGPADIQCCAPRGTSFACDPELLVAANQGLVEGPGSGGCPAGMVRVDASAGAFCVDRFEAALIEISAGGVEVPWSPYHHPGGRRVRAVSLEGAVPQGYVDQLVASAACEEAGKRLCTDAEWLRACRGASALTYPYGATRQPGACNDARATHPAVELFPDDPTPFDRIQDACINQLPDSLAETGAHPACVTEDGALDMMGNLHEWTSDPAGTFRGGFYVDTVINGNGCLYATTAHNTLHWDYSTGFRCCADLP